MFVYPLFGITIKWLVFVACLFDLLTVRSRLENVNKCLQKAKRVKRPQAVLIVT